MGLRDFLASVDAYHPKLASLQAKRRAAQAYLTSARGAYDPKLTADADLRPVGQYRFGAAGVKVSQLTPFWGLSALAGYKLGWGEFPIYMGEKKTGSLGKLHAGVGLPLLAGGRIDKARAKVRQGRFALSGQRCELARARLDLLAKAADVYWDWVARALELKIKQELLAVAKARGRALQTRLDNGAIAAIVLLDNQRLIIDRESKLIEAQRKLGQSSAKMSFYWRDRQGEPRMVEASQVPATLEPQLIARPEDELNHSVELASRDIERALARMPVFCGLRAKIEAARVKVDLTRNQRLPNLDLQGYVGQYLGDKIPLRSTDVGVGLQFGVALGRRKVTGTWRAAQASLESLLQEQRRVRDEVVIALNKARVDLRAARRQLQIADRKVRLSQDMAQAERDRFEQGASDLVVVNLREQALADAQRDRVIAWAAFQKAKVQQFRAQGLDPLGQEGASL